MGDKKPEYCKRGLHRMEGANVRINNYTKTRYCWPCRLAYARVYSKQYRRKQREVKNNGRIGN